ncbi:MAG: CDP-alcohol phosphatidyltransferase family protein [Waddliaceae bacterium]
MIDSYFRAPYQWLLIDPFLSKISALKISPHMYTACSLITGVAIAPVLFFGQSVIAVLLLLVSGFLDTLDGSVARAKQSATSTGAVFDIVSDRIVETAIILGLFLYEPNSRALLCLLMLGSALICVTSFLVVGIFLENDSSKSFFYSPGIIERAEAFLFFGCMILFPSLFDFLSIGFILLVTLTACIRVRQFHSSEESKL